MMQCRWLTICSVASAVAAAVATDVRAENVRIWPTATVTRDVITAGDIAELNGVIAQRDRLRDIVVHVAPQPGSAIRISVAHIREAFAENKADLADLNFIGSSACKVTRPRLPDPPKAVVVREVAPPRSKRARHKSGSHARSAGGQAEDSEGEVNQREATLETVLRNYIESEAPAHEGKLDIRFGAANRAALALPVSECRFDIQPDSPGPSDNWLGTKSYRVDVTRADQKTTPVAIMAEIGLICPVVVAKRPINLGQKLDAAALRVEQRRFDDSRTLGISDMRTAIGQTAAAFIDANALVAPKALADAPVVKRGEAVTIWRRGGVQIRLTGKAQGDGMLGSLIKVRRNGSKNNRELLDAVVTGPGTVELCSDVRMASK